MAQLNAPALPAHIGIIMDGNRRWAKSRHLPAKTGHSEGAKVFKQIALYCNKIGLENLTVFAFSTENWKRSSDEVTALMFLFKHYLKSIIKDFQHENVKINFFGDKSKFSDDIRELMDKVEQESQKNTGLTLNIAVNYGSRAEIVNAAKLLAQDISGGKLRLENISEKDFENKLYSRGIADIDLIIRTAGEKRLSNFMLWQAAYAELYVTDTLWPDFNEESLNIAIEEYFKRNRRFGGE